MAFAWVFFVDVQAEAEGLEVKLSNLKVFGYEHKLTQVHVI
jgi:hypothetical protein